MRVRWFEFENECEKESTMSIVMSKLLLRLACDIAICHTTQNFGTLEESFMGLYTLSI